MRFQSDPNLKPTEIQPPTTEERTPGVLARKPATRARLRRALRKGGTMVLNGGMLVLNLQKNNGLLITSSSLEKRISLAIAFLITFCIGVAAALVWRSSSQVFSVPQSASAPVALSPMEHRLEAISSGLAVVQQSVNELSSGLGQMSREITNLQTTEQALFDKVSEPLQQPPAAPPARSAPRPSQAPTRRIDGQFLSPFGQKTHLTAFSCGLLMIITQKPAQSLAASDAPLTIEVPVPRK